MHVTRSGNIRVSLEKNQSHPRELLNSQIPVLQGKDCFPALNISGGNLVCARMADNIRQVILIGESSIITSAVEQNIPAANYPAFKQGQIDLFKRQLQLAATDEVILVPQNSYHLDFDIATPKPGIVVINSYQDILEHPRHIDRLVQQISRQSSEIGDPCGTIEKSLSRKEQIARFTQREANLNALAEQLTRLGLQVVRTLGNLAFVSLDEGG